jgi:divalent metal cation (Fe/Co/Zn/Cd) transporter
LSTGPDGIRGTDDDGVVAAAVLLAVELTSRGIADRAAAMLDTASLLASGGRLARLSISTSTNNKSGDDAPTLHRNGKKMEIAWMAG